MVGKIGDFREIFDGNRSLSWKWSEIGFLWNWVSAYGSEETRMMGYQMVKKVLR